MLIVGFSSLCRDFMAIRYTPIIVHKIMNSKYIIIEQASIVSSSLTFILRGVLFHRDIRERHASALI